MSLILLLLYVRIYIASCQVTLVDNTSFLMLQHNWLQLNRLQSLMHRGIFAHFPKRLATRHGTAQLMNDAAFDVAHHKSMGKWQCFTDKQTQPHHTIDTYERLRWHIFYQFEIIFMISAGFGFVAVVCEQHKGLNNCRKTVRKERISRQTVEIMAFH